MSKEYCLNVEKGGWRCREMCDECYKKQHAKEEEIKLSVRDD